MSFSILNKKDKCNSCAVLWSMGYIQTTWCFSVLTWLSFCPDVSNKPHLHF